MQRPYYQDMNYHPVLYYVVFGVGTQIPEISGKKYHVYAIPEGLNVTLYHRPENNEVMDALIGGTMGELLNKADPALFRAVQNTERWVVLRGTIQHDETLDYMRNVIGIVQAFLDEGALGVLDLQTASLVSAQDWKQRCFAQEFSPFAHVNILASAQQDGKLWLHTRGMRKFGRPDVSVTGVAQSEVQEAAQVVNQMIYYGVYGFFFSQPTNLHTHTGNTYVVDPKFVEDFDNPDFNNAYYEFPWKKG